MKQIQKLASVLTTSFMAFVVMAAVSTIFSTQANAQTAILNCTPYASSYVGSISGATGWGGQNAGIVISPDHSSGDNESGLEGEIIYTISEPAGPYLYVNSHVLPGTTYNLSLEFSDSTVLDTTTCTTATSGYPIISNTTYFDTGSGLVDVNYYATKTMAQTGSDLRFETHISNGAGGTDFDMGDTAQIMIGGDTGFQHFTGADSIAYVGGDLNSDNRINPGETWVIEQIINNISASDLNHDSVNRMVDPNPDTLIVTSITCAWDRIGSIANCTDFSSKSISNEFIGIGTADLALNKTISSQTDNTVVFDINIHNQGAINAHNISIVDYLPEGTSLATTDSNGWSVGAGGHLYNTISSLAAGSNTTIQIEVTVDSPFAATSTTFINNAEIASAEDASGNNLVDSDSTANNTLGDDCGGTVNILGEDDELLGNGGNDSCSTDEDDHDPEDFVFAPVASIDIEKLVGNYDDTTTYDADTIGDQVLVGATANVPYTIIVTNDGSTALTISPVQLVVDAGCINLNRVIAGDNDGADILSIGESWTYSCVVENVSAATECQASVSANPVTPAGTDIVELADVMDTDTTFIDIGGTLYLGDTDTVTILPATGLTPANLLLIGLLFVTGVMYIRELSIKKTIGFNLSPRKAAVATTSDISLPAQALPPETQKEGSKTLGKNGVKFKTAQ